MSHSPISPKDALPNPFTQAVGTRIRAAREDRGLSQIELARRIERRQASISDMERGLMQPNAATLVVLAQALGKSVTYFFPAPYGAYGEGDLAEDEQLLLQAFRRLGSDERRQIALALLSALVKFDT
jgi:transcriptional regulator with XRE-family HTH domain